MSVTQLMSQRNVEVHIYGKSYTQILEYCIHCKRALRANLGKVCLLVAGLTVLLLLLSHFSSVRLCGTP